MPTLTDDPYWEPGDRLYPDGDNGLRTRLYNFRQEPEIPNCYPCPDAATWPVPHVGYRIPPGDEIGDLIRLVREDRARE